jgi:hypothetical protein
MFIARAIAGGDGSVPLVYQDPRTLRLYNCNPASATIHFTDAPATVTYCRHVHYLWARGVIDGCSISTYCPSTIVTRGQTAKFIANAFDLAIYGP